MRAIVLREFGGPERLRVEEVPDPVAAPGEVVVRVAAAGVCYADLLVRQGAYTNLRPPLIPGHEIAGQVVEVGAGVTGLRAGDRVVALPRSYCGSCTYCVKGLHSQCARAAQFGDHLPGGYAEYVSGPSTAFVPVPDGVPLEEAACLACAAGTAMHAIRESGLAMGETVVVNGAGGGVGSHAVQLARILGARVIAVTTSPDKEEGLRRLGADEVIVSPDLDYARPVKERTGGEGADVVLEILGSVALPASLSSVRKGGTVVLVGSVRPVATPFRPAIAILKQLTVKGVAGVPPRDLYQLLALARQGRLRPVVGERFPLEAAPAAHASMESRTSRGRLLLIP